ncbi:NSS family neurotransmitter:Na+ symporter [Litorimonas taeanensis]|uniref:NSS family neurotransmitter:Na+ symporter n=1 Tax=Litorimonas taeanensis TaxID=568099 RepID=A0A420WJC1_9PROT|nr:sodium-dependent transporter [Litorimonas taeanensis]RKQ71110.1 NSS family neurotransmitter:Na+ symporter [Litorimonas taeanensis]
MAIQSGPGTAQWSSRFAFIMAAVGSSVGLGNLWRFSAELGTNGGAAFLIVYIACIILVGVPVLMGEYIIGRAGQASSAIESVNDLTRRSKVSGFWASGAWFGMSASFLVVSFYCVVAAWVLAYIPKFLFGGFNGQTPDAVAGQFGSMLENPMSVLPWFIAFGLLTTWLVSRGVNKGIEVAAKVLMPIFFLLLAGLALYSIITGIASGGTAEAFGFMFTPDFSKITPQVATSALGQACFSISIGNAIMITYGSYLPRDVSIPKAAVTVSFVDTLVAIIAGLAIFPIVFSHNLDFSAGAGIFFQTLPTALGGTTIGNIVGAAFFFLAFFAAITSSVSLLEPSVAYVAEKFKIAKSRAAWLTGGAIMLLGLGSLYSPKFFDFIDTGLAGPILAPLSALLISLFVGWRLDRAILANEIAGDGQKIGEFIVVLTKYVAPIFMGIVLVWGTYSKWVAPLLS